MRINRYYFRLTAGLTLTALLLDTIVPGKAAAQPVPPPVPQPYRAQQPDAQTQPPQDQVDPPSRVGRVAHLAGTVFFQADSDDPWTQASLNFPVSSGDAFWTEPSASAELEISDSRISLAATTKFDITTLDSNGLQAVAAQGETYIQLRALAPQELWSVQTPRGLVHLNMAGSYHISVGSTEQPTRITVLDGAAEVDGPEMSLHVASGQTATIDGNDRFEGSVGPAVKDPFLIARLDTEHPRPAPPISVPPEVAAMPGGSDLSEVGSWSEAPDYGQVWYPPVPSGWVPYREGHWAYVAPWGWTWIDDAPWGFAPFHYGRWVEIGNRWAWTPGRRADVSRPVYAPALVTFIGIGAGVAAGAVLASHSIGWIPLGPQEAFHPWYHVSDRYLRDLNVNHGANLGNTIAINNFVNQHAVTAIPGSEMERSRPVQVFARPVTAQDLASARPIIGQQPIYPPTTTISLTPNVARTFTLPVTGPLPPTPGPVVRPRTPGPPVSDGIVRPSVISPGQSEPNGPRSRAAVGSPPLQPNRVPGPAFVSPGTRPALPTVPRWSLAPSGSPPVNQRLEPNIVGPAGAASTAPVSIVVPGPIIHSDQGPMPQVQIPFQPRPQHFVQPQLPYVVAPVQIPHVEPQRFAQPPARLPPTPSPPAPLPPVVAPAPMRHSEPHRFVPHQEPPHFATPMSAPRPEPPRAAAAQAVVRERRPGER